MTENIGQFKSFILDTRDNFFDSLNNALSNGFDLSFTLQGEINTPSKVEHQTNDKLGAPPHPGRKFISSYWENWALSLNPQSTDLGSPNYYLDDFRGSTHIFYSFMTLDKVPDPDHPRHATWNG